MRNLIFKFKDKYKTRKRQEIGKRGVELPPRPLEKNINNNILQTNHHLLHNLFPSDNNAKGDCTMQNMCLY